MRIVFMGTPSFAVPSLVRLCGEGHTIAGVFTQPDKPSGRKLRLTPPPVKQEALARGLPVFQPRTLKDEACRETLQKLAPDLIVVVAYGKILPPYVLTLPQYGCVNVHGSLLPRWRGAAPIQWAVLAGDRTAGITTMQMDEGLDTGDMLLRYETAIGARETAGELYDRLAVQGAVLLLETMRQMEQGTLHPEKQDDSASCYASMLDRKQARMDWTRSVRVLDCQVRGLNPWPVAATTLHGERLKIYAAEPASASGEPGVVLVSDAKRGLVVACGDGALRLTEVQAVNGKRMRAEEYLRGHPIAQGERMGG